MVEPLTYINKMCSVAAQKRPQISPDLFWGTPEYVETAVLFGE